MKNKLPKGLNIVGSVRSAGKIGQVELNLVPPFVQSHRHRANERFYSCCALVVRSSETSAHILVIEDLDFESEVLFQLSKWLACKMGQMAYILDDHDQEGQLDAQRLGGVGGAGDVARVDVGADELQHAGWRCFRDEGGILG